MRRLSKLFGIAVAAALIAGPALAADMATKGPALTNPFAGYANGGCGAYFGLNSMGGAAAVNGGTPGASVIQGDIGVTVGYGCPIGVTPGNFWFAEGNFDWANMNGTQSGFALTGPAHFEQRFGLGSPLSTVLSLFPSLTSGLSVPSLPALPSGIVAGPSYPFMFASLHEQDISAQFGLAQNREWLVSPGIGIGLESRLSNHVVADVTAQYILDSSGLTLGANNKVALGNGAEVGLTLKY
jgi:hypothetical protein